MKKRRRNDGTKMSGRKERDEGIREWGQKSGKKWGCEEDVEGGGVFFSFFLSRPVSDNVTWHTLLILAQWRDPASPSASGSGAFARVGVTSNPPSTHVHTHTHTHTISPSPFLTPILPSSPDRHPARPAHISIKQSQANLLPCRVGGVKRGVERRRAFLDNGPSDEKGPW